MKRLVGLILMVCIFTLGQAQSVTDALTGNRMLIKYTGAAGDTAKATTAKNFDFLVGKDFRYWYDLQASIDSSGDGADYTITLSGSNDDVNYYTIGSTITWYVVSTDTVVRFTNIPVSGNETWTIAQHTEVNAQHTEVTAAYLITCSDTLLYSDTLNVAAQTNTVGAQTVTVGAQTYTIAKPYPVGWRYLRLTLTGGESGARAELEQVVLAILKPE